ncbi:aromatase/cyclase [Kitasatospora sp. NBC_01266]|jgi:aromatase|uniref:aromatase/cyclase n=1 Tax=Kitasatospora sp. NBC_01266 TaxID=2903572 RepID=UPI002E36CA12|nr:SRPBCC family protein [Kitasatospora sp. NBC_01266]
MSAQRVHATQHSVRVAAPAGVVYGMLADARRWPVFLPSHVHVERMDFDGVEEQLRVWDVGTDQVRSSLARRVLDPQARSIEFEQREVAWPGTSTTGSWTVEPQGEDRSLVTLRQDRPWTAGDASGPGAEALERDAREQLAHIREMAEHWDKLDELLLSFEDSVHVQGPPELVYDFLYRIEDWVDMIPHVEWSSVTEDQPGVQVAALSTCAEETGETVTVEAVRLCFPHAGRIVYKETVTAELIAAHSGEWYLVPDESGVRVVSAHHVMLREEAVEPVLGAGACLADARRYVREWLGGASTEALGLAKWHAESTVQRLR